MDVNEARILLRLPFDLKSQLASLARENRRSTTKEILVALERYVISQPEARP